MNHQILCIASIILKYHIYYISKLKLIYCKEGDKFFPNTLALYFSFSTSAAAWSDSSLIRLSLRDSFIGSVNVVVTLLLYLLWISSYRYMEYAWLKLNFQVYNLNIQRRPQMVGWYTGHMILTPWNLNRTTSKKVYYSMKNPRIYLLKISIFHNTYNFMFPNSQQFPKEAL